MDFENYTERARGFVQSAYALALRSNHQRLTPEHLLKKFCLRTSRGWPPTSSAPRAATPNKPWRPSRPSLPSFRASKDRAPASRS